MNILYINNSVHLGGDTKCILKLCKEFKKDNKVIVASSGGKLLQEFLNMGIKHFDIKDASILNVFKILFNIFKLLKIVREEKIQLIHSHHRMTTVIARIVSFFTNVKVTHTQHLCIEDKFFFTRIALRNLNVIAVSNSARNILINKCKLEKDKIITIYNTVETTNENKDVDNFLLEAKINNYFIIAQIGRIVGYKGVYDFVDIAKEVILTNEYIRFFLIGEGEESERIKAYIKNNNLEKYVVMLGCKDNIIEHLKYIDLVLLCSYIEGLPLVPIEAFSQCVPVIATNISGTCEEIINCENGYLEEIKDIKGFANRINEIYYDVELYKNLKVGAYRSFNKNFSVKNYVFSHLEFYNKLLIS